MLFVDVRGFTALSENLPPPEVVARLNRFYSLAAHAVFDLDGTLDKIRKRDDEGLWKGFNVEIGDGDCDWPAVMAALRAINYQGWATAEVAGGDADRLKDIAGRMDSVLAS